MFKWTLGKTVKFINRAAPAESPANAEKKKKEKKKKRKMKKKKKEEEEEKRKEAEEEEKKAKHFTFLSLLRSAESFECFCSFFCSFVRLFVCLLSVFRLSKRKTVLQ